MERSSNSIDGALLQSRNWMYLITVLGSVAVFLVDLDLPLGINAAVLYLAVIVATLWIPERFPTVIATAVAILLTLIELHWSMPGGMQSHTLIERLLTIGVMLLIMGVVLYRKHVDLEWRELLEKQQRQQKIIVGLASDPNVFEGGLANAARYVTKKIADALETERASVWLLNDQNCELTCVDLYERTSGRHQSGTVLKASDYPRYFQALSSSLAVDAHDARLDPRTSEFTEGYLVPLGITSMLDAAIRISGRVRGVICYEHIGPVRQWRRDEISFAAEVADLLGQAILGEEGRKAQKALEESEAKYRSLVETSHDLIWSVDKEGRWIYLNRQATRSIFGYEPEEMLGRKFTEFETPEQASKDLEAFEEIKTGKPYFQYETVQIRKDGTPAHLIFNAIVLRDDNGQVVGTTGTATDISNRVEAEKQRSLLEGQLRESQKMEALGQLAGGVAHDFNNILGAMIGYTELLQAEISSDDPQLARYASLILSAGIRARDLISQILTFSRRKERSEEQVSLIKVVEEVTDLVRLGLPPGIDIRSDLKAHPTITGDANQLYQMIMNLCTNATYAMRGIAGEIVISVDELSHERIPPSHAAQLLDEKYALMTIRDRGVGIRDEHLEHLFEPFFTTKPLGEGTGLGLAVVHGIVESHGGRIFVDTAPGKGTEFQIYLPISKRRVRGVKSVPQNRLIGSERILLVDDEEVLAQLGSEMLRRYGYSVTAVTDPKEALRILKSGDEYDLLVTDLSMAGMSGEELIAELRRIDINLPVILCSGYRMQSSEEPAKVTVSAELSKPFTTLALVGTVRRVLDERIGVPSEETLNLH